MATLKERMAMLQANAGSGGIPLPQGPGGAPPAPGRLSITRESSNSSSAQSINSSVRSSGRFDTAAAGEAQGESEAAAVQSPSSAKETAAAAEGDAGEGSLTNAAMSRPTIAAGGRRRPSADRRASAYIPEENRIALADILEASKGSDAERINDLERRFSERILKLEEEVSLMRAALLKAGIAIPEPAPKSSPTAAQAFKKKPVTHSSPTASAPPPPPPSASVSASSPRPALARRDSASAAPSGPPARPSSFRSESKDETSSAAPAPPPPPAPPRPSSFRAQQSAPAAAPAPAEEPAPSKPSTKEEAAGNPFDEAAAETSVAPPSAETEAAEKADAQEAKVSVTGDDEELGML